MVKEQLFFELNMPTKLYCGIDSVNKLPELCRKFGDKILLVVPNELLKTEERVLSCLKDKGYSVETFYLESCEPTCVFIDSSAKRLREKRFDCIIGLGGGSAMDMAKALSIVLTHSEPIWMYANLSNRLPLPIKNSLIPVIAIPTTSGTGSEVTPYAVLTNSETNQKGTIQNHSISPSVAILDPTLTLSMPSELTAATGIDAFAHAFESYINISKISPVAEWASKEAMRIIFNNLYRVFKNPDDLDLRMKMLWASSIAGVAISHRGTTTTHAIAESLGALTHIPHAHGVAISTVPVLKETWISGQLKLAELYRIINIDFLEKKSDSYYAEIFVNKIQELIESVGLKRSVVNYLPEDKIQNLRAELSNNIFSFKFRPLEQHPVKFSKEQIFSIINEIIYG